MAKHYCALDKAPTFRFEEREGSQGVTEVFIHREGGQFYFQHTGWAPGVIKLRGEFYIADEILRNLESGWHSARPSLKYGPGGRRLYVHITDKLLDEVASCARPDWARNVRERARSIEVAAFACALRNLFHPEVSNG